MIVVDTNVIVALFVSSPSTNLAKEAARKDGHWIMPPLWVSEMRNVVATMHRTRRLEIADGLKAMEDAENQFSTLSVPVPSQDVLEYAAESGCSAYDCEFVALAVLAQTRLITLDKRLALRFPRVATPLDRFVGAQLKELLVKNLPDAVHECLVRSAEAHGRSLNSEILALLETVVTPHPLDVEAFLADAKEIRAKMKGPPLTLGELMRARNRGRGA